jgi:hypothetical protein
MRLARLGLVVAVIVLTAACGDDDEGAAPGTTESPSATSAPGVAGAAVYFGAVSMTTDRVAVALDAADAEGRQRVRAFLSDGEPGGDAEWFDGTGTRGKFDLRSSSGRARLEGEVRAQDAHGTVTLADGRTRHFHTIPATHGAGIYDMTVAADGRYTGTSTDGSRIEGRQTGTSVEGTITTKSGDTIGYKVTDVSRVFDYRITGGQPDTYTVVVSRYGLVQVGRGGGDAVKRGAPNDNLLALDLGPTRIPTPGVYYGKLAQTTDQLAMVVDQPAGQANRRVRVYLSDGEPEPEGDIEWFVGQIAGTRLDLTSAGGGAKLEGELTADYASGTVTLPGSRIHRFYAVPAGDGAGIYEVRVTPEKVYQGTSEDGGKLEIRQNGDVVQGTITTGDGRQFALLAYDLTRVFAYGVAGSQPDTYLAFASPGGRYLIGRSGDVRGGTSGNNIIGLDKAC